LVGIVSGPISGASELDQQDGATAGSSTITLASDGGGGDMLKFDDTVSWSPASHCRTKSNRLPFNIAVATKPSVHRPVR
jgi:hypothetical protein